MASRSLGMRALRASSVARQGTLAAARPANTVSAVRMASTGGTSDNGGYNEPTGFLFGERPPPPGQKRVKEDWENIWMYGMFGGMLLAVVSQIYKPDTSIDTWAKEEARKRLDEREGNEWKYTPSKYSGWYKTEQQGQGEENKLV